MLKTLYRDIKFLEGTTFKKGDRVTVKPISGNTSLCLISNPSSKEYRIRYQSVFKEPSLKSFEKWTYGDTCKSVTGKTIEPDGYDSEGFPSWLLVVGLI